MEAGENPFCNERRLIHCREYCIIGSQIMYKYNKSMFIHFVFSVLFVISGLYVAMHYFIEYPVLQIHREGIIPLVVCFFYYIFS